jgi:hypothetical protein
MPGVSKQRYVVGAQVSKVTSGGGTSSPRKRRMRLQVIPAFVLLLGVPISAVAGEQTGTVALQFHRGGKPTKAAEGTLRMLGMELLKSSSFNTAAHPGILKQSVPAIQDRYRRVVAGDCLVITYVSPVKVRTIGGEVSVFEIVIGLAHPDSADALFTIDDGGRVVAHEKYSGRIAMELRKAADARASAR